MKRACVIGWPIRHSRSPLIHTHWLQRYGIEGTYDRRAVEPDRLESFLASMRDEGLAGCNVTIPHKEAVFALVHVEDEFTQTLGAVNTVYFSGERLCGTNTDGPGFWRNLEQQSPDWRPGDAPATVLGAGGAARAIVAMLVAGGVPEIRIANRTAERSQNLATAFPSSVKSVPWDERSQALEDCGLLVNTTSLGMAGAPPLDIDLDRLPERATVNDIVYTPLDTGLLIAARRRGNTAVDGLGMLLHQAAPGFALWFGHEPEVTPELRKLIVDDLEAG